jgi:hypothetical protein
MLKCLLDPLKCDRDLIERSELSKTILLIGSIIDLSDQRDGPFEDVETFLDAITALASAQSKLDTSN